MTQSNALEIQHKLTDYFASLPDGKGAVVKPDQDLFASGALDSFGVLQLALFIEEKFGVALDFEAISEDDFRTVEAIAGVIAREGKTA